MLTIYINYIADYIERSTRANAFHRLMSEIQINMPELTEQDAMELITKANKFTTSYNTAWPWQRTRIVSEAIRIQ
ncbi:MAG: hypothetical protein WAU36_04095 [Cyclobacteriaceae bacterium]